MKFGDLLEIIGSEPLFESSLLLAGQVDPVDIGRQLSRWVKSGRIMQLRRGLYALAPPYRKVAPHPFLVANAIVGGSYVSCHSALSYYGMISERVPLTTSVGTRRPLFKSTLLGDYRFHNISEGLLFSYALIEVAERQYAYIATPEKALLDLVHLVRAGERLQYLRRLRLCSLDKISAQRLEEIAGKSGSPKISRAVGNIRKLISQAERKFITL